MDTQTPPTKPDPLAQVRNGTVAFLLVTLIVVWGLAARYDPPMAHPFPTGTPPPASATPTDAPRLLTALPTGAAGETITPDVGMPAPPFPEVTSDMGAIVPQVSPPPTVPVQPVTRTARPTSTGGLVPGKTQSNPIPVRTPVELGDGFILTIVDSTLPADDIVLTADPLAMPAGPNLQYLLVVIELTCNKPSTQTCSFFTDELMAIDAEGNSSIPEIGISGIDDLLSDGDFPGGITLVGEMLYIVPQNDPTVVIYYDSFENPGEETLYLAFQ